MNPKELADEIRIIAIDAPNKDVMTCEFGNWFAEKVEMLLSEHLLSSGGEIEKRLAELGKDVLLFAYDMNDCLNDGGVGEDLRQLLEDSGYIVNEKYDPKIHGEEVEADEGDIIYVFTPEMIRIALAQKKASQLKESK